MLMLRSFDSSVEKTLWVFLTWSHFQFTLGLFPSQTSQGGGEEEGRASKTQHQLTSPRLYIYIYIYTYIDVYLKAGPYFLLGLDDEHEHT